MALWDIYPPSSWSTGFPNKNKVAFPCSNNPSVHLLVSSISFSKAQPLLLTLDEGYLLTFALPDLQLGIAPLRPPAPAQPRLLGRGLVLLAAAPGLGRGLGRGVGPPGCRP